MDLNPTGGIEPFFFGTPKKPLYGCYHAPRSGPMRGGGIVLCYPIEREYIRSHRAFRQLAARLCGAGFPVLRFDFYGCGDSGGDDEQGGIGQWLADISLAIGEIRRKCELDEVCLVGLRLGGSLAMMAGAERGDIERMVLWDPIVSGKAYIEELTTTHRQLLRTYPTTLERGVNGEKVTGILGMRFTESKLTDLDNLNLLAIRRPPASNVLVIKSTKSASDGPLVEHLKGYACSTEDIHIPAPNIWRHDESALVPIKILQAIESWLSGVSP